TLQRECPQPSWSLCDIVPMLPVTETAFLFGDNSLVLAAGGYKTVDPQVVPIISATLRAEPREVALLAMKNAIAQFVSFASGDSLLKNLDHVRKWWPVTFPSAELAQFES